jgi:hypothetical protein
MSNMDIITDKGVAVTDEMFDKMAAEYESGTWEGGVGRIVMGRPRLSDEDTQTISFKLTKSRVAAIDRITEKSGETRSEFLRNAVDRALVATNR